MTISAICSGDQDANNGSSDRSGALPLSMSGWQKRWGNKAGSAGLLLASASLLLGGCGDRKATAVDPGASINASGDAIVTELLDKQIASRATGAMTGIDAATGDASAMAEDSNQAVAVETAGPANETAASASPPPAPALRPDDGDLLWRLTREVERACDDLAPRN